VALLELGASAGLLLHLDRYRYRYGEVEVGPQGSDVTISPELRGASPQDLALPTIDQRIGIDLNPLDPSDPADASWLKACVWPEDLGRLRRLDAALTIASAHDDVRFVTGDLVELLEPVVRKVDPDTIVLVMHSAAFAYLDEATFHGVEETLDQLGGERDMARLAFEGPFVEPFVSLARSTSNSERDEEIFLLGLTTWMGGLRTDQLLARAHPHGAWLEWLPPTSIRRFQQQDRSSVVELHHRGLGEFGADAGPGPWDDDFDDIPTHYLNADGEFLVITIDGEVVAMGALRRISEDTAEIKRMRVRGEFQRQGLGEQILHLLESKAREFGCRRLVLDTTVNQVPAQDFYRKHGYTETGRDLSGPLGLIFFEKLLKHG
jgi:ribosomal protein S18 acetylase RimI-like enzyme